MTTLHADLSALFATCSQMGLTRHLNLTERRLVQDALLTRIPRLQAQASCLLNHQLDLYLLDN